MSVGAVRTGLNGAGRFVGKDAPQLSQGDVAELFVSRHPDLRYTRNFNRWHVYNGAVWREDRILHVYDLARSLCREVAITGKGRLTIDSNAYYAAIETIVRADKQYVLLAEDWDRDLDSLNTPTGTVNLVTGEMRPNRKEDYFTNITAVAPGGDCPLWRDFLRRVTDGNQELEDFLQRVAGYCLTGRTQEDAIFFLWGTGGNGKNTFQNNLAGPMGTYSRAAASQTFMATHNPQHPTALARLRGARLVTTSEVQDGRWNEELLKALSGGGPITANFMHCDQFEFIPQCKLIISGNNKPTIRSVDPAWRRRFHLIPFKVTIAKGEVDQDLRDVKLPREWGGILQWAIEGCLEWRRHGLNPPECVRQATEQYLHDEDVCTRWMEETECRIGRGSYDSASGLYESYRKWAEAAGERFIYSQKRFGQELEKRGFRREHMRPGKFYFGLERKMKGPTATPAS